MRILRTILPLLALAGLVLMSSCEESLGDLSPALSLDGSANYVSSDITMSPDSVFQVSVIGTENTESGTRLDQFMITRQVTGGGIAPEVDTMIGGSTFSKVFTIQASDVETEEEFVFTLTDRDGESTTRSFVVTTEAPATTTPLGTAQAFTWERDGGAAGTGLDTFGLSWTSNTGSSPNFSAVISNGATKMVELTAADWALTTVEDLAAAIDGESDVTSIDIPFPATAIDTYIGVLHMGTYYILHVQESTSTACPAGTCVDITGESKS